MMFSGESKGTLGRKGLNTLIDTFGKNYKQKLFMAKKTVAKKITIIIKKTINFTLEIWTPVKPNAAVTRSFLYVHMHPKIANLKMSLKFLHVNFRDFLAIHAFSTCIHRKTTDILTIGFVADSPSTPGVVSMFLWLIIETLIQLT